MDPVERRSNLGNQVTRPRSLVCVAELWPVAAHKSAFEKFGGSAARRPECGIGALRCVSKRPTNQAAAKLWPDGQSPVGKRIHVNVPERPQGSALLPPNS